MKLIQYCTKKCLDCVYNADSATSIYSQVYVLSYTIFLLSFPLNIDFAHLICSHSGALACMGSWTHYISRCSAPSCSVQALIQTASFLLVVREREVYFINRL